MLKFMVISLADPLPILVICNSNESGPICAIDPFRKGLNCALVDSSRAITLFLVCHA